MAMKNDLNAETKADLIGFNSAGDGQAYLCLGNTLRGDSAMRAYFYDSTSSAISDGENVLDATGMGSIGRFIKMPFASKRQETYSGTTNASGIYAVTFATPYAVAPNIQPVLISGTNKETIVTNVTANSFSIHVETRADILGLLPSYSNVIGRSMDILVTEK